MTDFSSPFRGVAYFGIWASETADDYGRRDAVLILSTAAEVCSDEDVRESREVMAALAYLAEQGHDKRAREFMKSLATPDPLQRRQAARAACAAIKRVLPVT